MLTPELLARAVVAESDWRECELACGEIDFDKLRAHIVSALRSYGAERAREMRERCAGLADQDLATHIRALPDFPRYP